MDTNSISSNKVTLKISTPQGKEMALNKGEVLQAQVQDVGEDGAVTIMVKGKPIEAYSEVAVKPGQQLLLMVDDVRNGKTYLKVVTPELMGKIETTNISANLLDMGIAAREENILLSRKLLQYNLPVNQNNLNELNKNLSSLGGNNSRNLEIAAFALSRGITGKNALESLAQFLSSPGDTAKLMSVLGRLLNALDVQNANGLLENNTNTMNKAGLVTASPAQALTSLLNGETGNQITGSKLSPGSSVTTGSSATAIDENQFSLSKSTAETGNQLSGPKNGINPPMAGSSGSTLVSSNAAPGNSQQLSQASNTDSQANGTADKLTQSGQVLLEGDEAGSSPKINSSTRSSGDKLSNAASKGETLIALNNSGNEKGLADNPAGSRTDNTATNVKGSDSKLSSSDPDSLAKNNSSASLPNETAKAASGRTINQTGSTLSLEIPQPDKSPGSSQANASADSQVKPELALKDSAVTTGLKTEEQVTGTRSAANAAVSGDEPLAAQTIMAEDEIIQRLIGREENAATKIASPESLLAPDSLKQELLKLLDTVRSLMEIDIKATPDKIAGQLQGASNSEKDIIRALSLLLDMAKNQDMAAKIPELKEFSLSLEKLEKEITGQQLFNLGSRNAADNMSSFYYFAFPVKIDQEYSLCHLKINKDGRKSLKDVDKLSFVVSLNTSKLGTVLFHINWQKIGNLQLQGVAQNQASCKFLNQNIGELVSKLEALGYQVRNLGVKVSSSDEEFRIRPALQEVNERLRPLGIDVTV